MCKYQLNIDVLDGLLSFTMLPKINELFIHNVSPGNPWENLCRPNACCSFTLISFNSSNMCNVIIYILTLIDFVTSTSGC